MKKRARSKVLKKRAPGDSSKAEMCNCGGCPAKALFKEIELPF